MGIAYNTSIVRDGLLLHLDAANPKSYPGSGTTWKDLSGNGNDGTLVNGVGFDSANNGSLSFDGSNDYINVNNLGYSDHTIEGWVYPQQSSGGTSGSNIVSIIGGYTPTSGSGGKYTFIGPRGSNTFNFRIDDGSSSFRFVASASYNINEWYYVAFTYNSNGTCIAYLNGNSIGSLNFTSNIVFDSIPFDICRAQNGEVFNGFVSSVKAYNRALTEAEIKKNYEALRSRYGI